MSDPIIKLTPSTSAFEGQQGKDVDLGNLNDKRKKYQRCQIIKEFGTIIRDWKAQIQYRLVLNSQCSALQLSVPTGKPGAIPPPPHRPAFGLPCMNFAVQDYRFEFELESKDDPQDTKIKILRETSEGVFSERDKNALFFFIH